MGKFKKPDCIDCLHLRTTKYVGMYRCRFNILDGLKKEDDSVLFGSGCEMFDYEISPSEQEAINREQIKKMLDEEKPIQIIERVEEHESE